MEVSTLKLYDEMRARKVQTIHILTEKDINVKGIIVKGISVIS